MKFAVLPSLLIAMSLLPNGVEAAGFQVTMQGYVTSKDPGIQNPTSVKVGDTFSLSFFYDDATATSALVTSGGDLYTVVTQDFSPPITSWSGSLPQAIADFNTPNVAGGFDGWGLEQSWYRPPSTLHHRDWSLTSGTFTGNDGMRGFSLELVTEYAGSLGYGWWSIGSGAFEVTSNTIDRGTIAMTTLSIVPVPVPELSSLVLLLVGLGIFVPILIHQRKYAR
jgi:hypothetical protein